MGWSGFFRRARWDAERARELESYLKIETDDNIARGMPPGAARAAAQRKLGNRTRIREDIYVANTMASYLPARRASRVEPRIVMQEGS